MRSCTLPYTHYNVGHSSAEEGAPPEVQEKDHATASHPVVHMATGMCLQEEVWSMGAHAGGSQGEVRMNGGAAQLAPSLSEVQLVEAFFDVEQQLSIAAAGAAHPAALPQVQAYAHALEPLLNSYDGNRACQMVQGKAACISGADKHRRVLISTYIHTYTYMYAMEALYHSHGS